VVRLQVRLILKFLINPSLSNPYHPIRISKLHRSLQVTVITVNDCFADALFYVVSVDSFMLQVYCFIVYFVCRNVAELSLFLIC